MMDVCIPCETETCKIPRRVRIDAAMALGATAHLLEDTSAMDKLIQFYTDRCFDKDTHKPKQHMFDNLSEQFVNQVTCMLVNTAAGLPTELECRKTG